jgi:endonuclease YncB( thermonuclease family)
MRALLTLAASLIAVPAAAETVSGPATVIDGDTLEIGERRIRLFGIDAPEAQQTCDRRGEVWACGEESASQLRALIGSKQVACTGDETDQYGRLVAVCSAGYLDLNKTMVAEGWATAFRKYSTAYVADEIRAGSGRRGLWASDFVLPEAYRIARREEAQPQASQERQPATRQGPTACTIKGNHSRRGEWIYHLPGMPYYEQTRAEEMFCTEAEAQAAGYRRSRAR